LQITDRAEFVRRMTEDLPERPAYFSHVVGVNLRGAAALGELPPLRPLSQEAAQAAAGGNATLIDIREAGAFGAGHLPGSLNIGIDSHLFSTWTGFFAPFGHPVALVANAAGDATAARLELARIGYDNVLGWVDARTLRGTESIEQINVCDLRAELRGGRPQLVVDVRSASEWKAGHIAQARHAALPRLPDALGDLPRQTALAVVCNGGYRSCTRRRLFFPIPSSRLSPSSAWPTGSTSSERH
jgi:hydroxyacylglutathione hydrolase